MTGRRALGRLIRIYIFRIPCNLGITFDGCSGAFYLCGTGSTGVRKRVFVCDKRLQSSSKIVFQVL